MENNALNQLVAEGVLATLAYEDDIVGNGVEALAAMEHHTYSAILMDCHMPIMDGFETTRAIREIEGDLRRIPTIAMTAAAMAEDRERGLAAGMDDVVTKPIDSTRVGNALQEWIEVTETGAVGCRGR